MPALYLATGHTAGEECSSTYEGRHITVEESYLAHAYHSDGLVDKGDPCIIGENIVGVALNDAAAATDLIALDTEGIWFLNVVGSVSDGTSDGIAKALAPGDVVYIEQTPGSGVNLSGESDPNRFKQFGFLLGDVNANVTTATLVAVKVHGEGRAKNGCLDFGSGFTEGFNFPLEGSTTLRDSVLIRATIEPATILLAGEQMEYPDGPKVGCLPDVYHLADQRRDGPSINPCALASLRLAVEGELDSLATAAGDGHRVTAPFPVAIRGGKAVVTARAEAAYQVLVDGRRVVDVQSKGTDEIALE